LLPLADAEVVNSVNIIYEDRRLQPLLRASCASSQSKMPNLLLLPGLSQHMSLSSKYFLTPPTASMRGGLCSWIATRQTHRLRVQNSLDSTPSEPSFTVDEMNLGHIFHPSVSPCGWTEKRRHAPYYHAYYHISACCPFNTSSVALGLASGPQALRPGPHQARPSRAYTDGLQGPRAWLWFLRGPSPWPGPWPTERIPAS
jgi:hypothetical protein